MTIEKEFVPYQPSVELKELEFDEPCFATYDENENFELQDFFQTYETFPSHIIAAPTFSQAFRWFREKYSISYSIDWMTRDSKYYSGYYVHFRGINGNKLNRENFIVLNDELPPTKDAGYGVYKTYEEAELACLIKLIEIVKNRNNG